MPAATAGTQQLPQEKLAEDLDEMDEAIARLHVLYEKYFLGIDRKPPDRERKLVSEKMRSLKSAYIKNTALKFRLHTLFAKLVSFERMWDRTLREIEEGTYRRDLFKAKLHSNRGEEKAARPDPNAFHIAEDKLRKLYETYVAARQRTGESVAGLTYDAVAGKIRSQVPDLLTKHKAKNVEFKVVIKGGKALLKAVPH